MGNIKTISGSQTKHHMKSIFLKISIMATIFVISSSFVIDQMNHAEENNVALFYRGIGIYSKGN